MNNSVIINSTSKCISLDDSERVLFIIGIITNSICIFVFSIIIIKQHQQQHGNMFKYLLLKSIVDLLFSFINILDYFNVCQSSNELICVLVHIWVFKYLQITIATLSIVFEVAATVDCYININRKLLCCQNNQFFYSFSILTIILLFLFYLVYPLSFVVVKLNLDYYKIEKSKFGMFFYHLNPAFLDSLLRDFVLFIILVVLNLLILISLMKATQHRRLILVSNSNNNTSMLTSSQKAERRKMIMILATGSNYMIGHFPNFIWYFLQSYFNIPPNCNIIFVDFFLNLSYVDGIFLYFFFNNIFKQVFIELIPFMNRNN
jgi:hypothetical protein